MPSQIQEQISAIPFGGLHLKLRTARLLEEHGLATIGDLFLLVNTNFETIKGISPTAAKDIRERLLVFEDSLRDGGQPDWIQFWESSNIEILPKNQPIKSSPQEILKALPKTIKEILTFENGSDKHWRTIERRFGLEGAGILTLEEIGQAFGGLTRERIRQVERDSLKDLKDVLLENRYAGKKYHVQPGIINVIRALFESIAHDAKDFVLETELLRRVQPVVGEDLTSDIKTLRLLFEIFGLYRIDLETYESTPIWGQGTNEQRDTLSIALGTIDHLLTQDQLGPMDEFDILVKVNSRLPKGKKTDAYQLHRLLELCGSVEKRSDGMFQGKFEFLKTRSAQAERILLDADEPLHINELARRMNVQLVNSGRKKVNVLNIANIMSSDERFIPIGSSGLRGLKKWEHLESGNILDLMEQALISLNRPATEEELYDYIAARRPVKLGSIKIYLNSKPLFAKAGYGRWGLASWKETQDALVWSPVQVADFVAQLFKTHGVQELEFKIVTKALMTGAKVSKSQALGLLVHNPVVSSRRQLKPFKIFAIFNPNYRSQLTDKKPRFKRKSETQFQRAEKTVRAMFEAEPSKQIALSVLRNELQKKEKLPKQSAYQYISRMAFLKKIDLPETHTRVCRIEGLENHQFPQITELRSYDKRKADEAFKAIGKLTVDEVDTALFILGRLFESTLKDFMQTAEKLRVYSITPNNYSKLNNMIQWVEKEQLVSDKTALNFLRNERNDRAHGKPPSESERRIMFESSPWVATMYLNYIVFFEKESKRIRSK
jgi:hypothetical protein